MVINQDNIKDFSHLTSLSETQSNGEITIKDVECVCIAIIKVISESHPGVFLEYDVDLLDPMCYIYADGVDLAQTPYINLLST